jgi:hypothetical protein
MNKYLYILYYKFFCYLLNNVLKTVFKSIKNYNVYYKLQKLTIIEKLVFFFMNYHTLFVYVVINVINFYCKHSDAEKIFSLYSERNIICKHLSCQYPVINIVL